MGRKWTKNEIQYGQRAGSWVFQVLPNASKWWKSKTCVSKYCSCGCYAITSSCSMNTAACANPIVIVGKWEESGPKMKSNKGNRPVYGFSKCFQMVKVQNVIAHMSPNADPSSKCYLSNRVGWVDMTILLAVNSKCWSYPEIELLWSMTILLSDGWSLGPK